MQMCVITNNMDLYSEVLDIAQSVYGFDVCHLSSAEDAIQTAKEGSADLVLMDTAFAEKNFVTLARLIKSASPRTCMIVIADDGSLAAQAFEVHATGYMIKPVTEARLKEELDYYIDQFTEKQEEPAPVQVMTKGNFEIFLNGVPARFKYSKTKKLLEYVISKKGAMVSNDDLIKRLWNIDKQNTDKKEMKSINSYLRNIEADLVKVLTEAGCEDMVIKHWGEIAVAMDKINIIN